MSRAFDVRILWYFFKSPSSTTFFITLMAIGLTLVGVVQENGIVFIILGIIFFLINIWQLIRGFLTHVKGTEVDASAEKFMGNINLKQNVIDSLEIDEGVLEEIDHSILHGYCAFGIETEALYRWDEEDGLARSSNYQLTYVGLDKEILFLHTIVKSLIDAEFQETSHIWKITDIETIEIRKVIRDCLISPKKNSDIRKADFSVLWIHSAKGEDFTFALREDQTEDAQRVVDHVVQIKGKTPRLRMPGKKNSENDPFALRWEDLSKKQRTALSIGIISDTMFELK